MTGTLTDQGMRYLMQQHLFDFIERGVCDKVRAERDATISKITLTGPAHRPIKTKTVVDEPVTLEQLMRQIDNLWTHKQNPSLKALNS